MSAGGPSRAAVRADARALFPRGPILQRWRPWICPFAEIIAEVPPGSRVLDVGCGAGLLLGLLARSGRLASGVGFDASGAAIAAAQRMKEVLGDRAELEFTRRDAAVAWPEGRFDVVCLVDVLHHVPVASQRRVVAEAAGRVAAGGRLVYKDMCRRPRWRALANRTHDLLLARQWIHEAPIEDVDRWCAEAGLAVSRRERINMLWYGHDLLIAVRG